MTITRYYLIGINILTFILYALDKFFAQHDMYRIPEKVLLVLSCLGGCYGGLLSMHMFHHKTKKYIFNLVNIIAIVAYTYVLFVK